MLTEKEFEQWCSQLQLPQATRHLITQIRACHHRGEYKGITATFVGNIVVKKWVKPFNLNPIGAN